MSTVLALLFLTLTITKAVQPPEEVQYQWRYMNYTWPSADSHDDAIKNGDYIPKNNALGGLQVWKDKFYVSIPRWKPGVPVTLGVISYDPVDGNRSPNIEPFPNWEMQKIGDCGALQFVDRIEFDPAGRLWVLNSGVINILEKPTNMCPHKLVIFDIENNNKMILSYEFSKDLIDPVTGLLSDLRIDSEDGGYAYISNSDDNYGSIIVFSLKERKAWKVLHKSMNATSPVFKVKGDDVSMNAPISVVGLALSSFSREGPRMLFYSPLSSLNFFSVPTFALKKYPENIDSYIKDEGCKGSQSDSTMMTANNELYYGLLQDSSVAKWNPRTKTRVSKFADSKLMQWPCNFALDEQLNLWVSSNRLQRLFADKVNVNEVNYRILKLSKIAYKSYQYRKDGTTPEIPAI